MKSQLLIVSALCLMITSCSKDEDELVFQMVEDTRPVPTRYDKLSTTAFKNLLIGYGWKEAETHIINTDGTINKDDYWKDMNGGGPSIYEFSESVIINYFWSGAIPANVSILYPYTYDEATNAVYYENNGNFWFSIVYSSPSEVTIMKRGGWGSGYLYVILKRLSASELEQVRNSYTPYDQVEKYY